VAERGKLALGSSQNRRLVARMCSISFASRAGRGGLSCPRRGAGDGVASLEACWSLTAHHSAAKSEACLPCLPRNRKHQTAQTKPCCTTTSFNLTARGPLPPCAAPSGSRPPLPLLKIPRPTSSRVGPPHPPPLPCMAASQRHRQLANGRRQRIERLRGPRTRVFAGPRTRVLTGPRPVAVAHLRPPVWDRET